MHPLDYLASLPCRQSSGISSAKGVVLEMQCKDKTVEMTIDRKNASFGKWTDRAFMLSRVRSTPQKSAAYRALPNVTL